jgi:hypothetical protein
MVGRIIRALLLALVLVPAATAADTPAGQAASMPALAGTWKGPWYIGMSSGIATLNVAADGTATLALTNMEEFGAGPAALSKQSFDGQSLKFDAEGANGTALTATLKSENDGRKLRGNGKYGGFGARLELQKLP